MLSQFQSEAAEEQCGYSPLLDVLDRSLSHRRVSSKPACSRETTAANEAEGSDDDSSLPIKRARRDMQVRGPGILCFQYWHFSLIDRYR